MNSRLRFLTAGESHGPAILAILEGMPAGLSLSAADIDPDLERRQGIGPTGRPYPGASPRMSVEHDSVEILGGVMSGVTTGAPIALQVRNHDHAAWKGRLVETMTVPRPGHADLAGAVKYGYADLQLTLERSSARETAARVAVGAACRKLLAEFGISIGSYVAEIGGVAADVSAMPLETRLEGAARSELNCPTAAGTAAMALRISEAAGRGETVGGVFEVVARGLPPGLGSHVHWDRRLTASLAAALLGIPAIRGVEIGEAFASARLPGTAVHDELALAGDGSGLVRTSDRAGGLEGGITNGQPLVVRAAMKPIASMTASIRSVDLATGAEAAARPVRSDTCAVPRAAVVGEAMVCVVVADAILEKLGGDSLAEMKPRYEALRRLRLEDLPMRRGGSVLWP
jgi:chorismate synthase